MAQAHLRPHGTEGSTAYRAFPQDVTASSYTSFQIQGIILISLGSLVYRQRVSPLPASCAAVDCHEHPQRRCDATPSIARLSRCPATRVAVLPFR